MLSATSSITLLLSLGFAAEAALLSDVAAGRDVKIPIYEECAADAGEAVTLIQKV